MTVIGYSIGKTFGMVTVAVAPVPEGTSYRDAEATAADIGAELVVCSSIKSRAELEADLAGRRDVRTDPSGRARSLPRRQDDRLRPGHGRRLARAGQKRGAATGPSPVDRAKTGSKHHILTCGNGFPLAVALSAANVNDHLLLPTLLDRDRPLRGRAGRPRHRITTLIADKGYDYPSVYSELRQRHITGYIARRGTRDKVTAGRWIVEQSFALLHQYRRLAIRWERRTDIHHGFLDLAAALICWRRLSNRTR
ncbi:IS5 family transposase [Nocardia brasiliensis]|uniref:IS5 family transposase n=1 Tax=Nocardia brasiliensis TaxID=37326 RepID=UPI00366BD385